MDRSRTSENYHHDIGMYTNMIRRYVSFDVGGKLRNYLSNFENSFADGKLKFHKVFKDG